ncbi:MAG: hypothetical protein A2758_02300 [Candidatus Zambryskibacteria bacterium RIFCSPHIGHO2_01_FULL_49_18]|uniref:Uncharacterized protein n=2 Tax=Candidatus Zambryskiibacteriota TaxID=1817925 RepID=A0A1G2T208_9BACT|nr:MAG: hypothetical protein A2758_02300 [Candidatus Zambryskibacteria bacterium RIFCSPHIGHO2_01_FULL_49_18]OHB06155.1 MAG: hypothetical protein A3A26_01260 [Candidatus Zambryskibacteria bacterium RIFCSPLOWO2_01_FULL_47_14]
MIAESSLAIPHPGNRLKIPFLNPGDLLLASVAPIVMPPFSAEIFADRTIVAGLSELRTAFQTRVLDCHEFTSDISKLYHTTAALGCNFRL